MKSRERVPNGQKSTGSAARQSPPHFHPATTWRWHCPKGIELRCGRSLMIDSDVRCRLPLSLLSARRLQASRSARGKAQPPRPRRPGHWKALNSLASPRLVSDVGHRSGTGGKWNGWVAYACVGNGPLRPTWSRSPMRPPEVCRADPCHVVPRYSTHIDGMLASAGAQRSECTEEFGVGKVWCPATGAGK